MATTTAAWMASAPPEVRRRFEYLNGKWVEKPVSGWDHNDYAADLRSELKRRGLRANVDVVTNLPTGDEVHPDVLVVSRSNPNQPGPGPYSGVPDLIAGVLSAANPGAYDMEKRDICARAGVRHYWLVRLAEKTVEPMTLGEDGAYHPGPLVPLLPLDALPVPADLT
jgi:Uma2 family endonuclease